VNSKSYTRALADFPEHMGDDFSPDQIPAHRRHAGSRQVLDNLLALNAWSHTAVAQKKHNSSGWPTASESGERTSRDFFILALFPENNNFFC
ncbi:MAG: hypothetical protein WBO58_11015, partial [Gammaproteobacteria bacterium]